MNIVQQEFAPLTLPAGAYAIQYMTSIPLDEVNAEHRAAKICLSWPGENSKRALEHRNNMKTVQQEFYPLTLPIAYILDGPRKLEKIWLTKCG